MTTDLQIVRDGISRAIKLIDAFNDSHAREVKKAKSLAELARELHRVPDFFSDRIQSKVKIVPISGLRSPAFVMDGSHLDGYNGSPTAGLTLGGSTVYINHEVHQHLSLFERVVFHEMVHVIQWRELGVHDFVALYLLGVLRYGYRNSPLEVIAYDLESQFGDLEICSGIAVNKQIRQHAKNLKEEHADLLNALAINSDADSNSR